MKIALVYDRVNKIGGAERILEALHELYPEAPLYTLVYDSQKAEWAKNWQVKTSFLQYLPFANRYHEFFPIIPIFAFEQIDFSNYNIVISVTATEAKGIITGPQTLHIAYILTPTRYLWSHYQEYFDSPFIRWVSLPVISVLRVWDQVAAKRPDVIIAISKTVRMRINKYYKRDCKIIYPPVDTQKFNFQSASWRTKFKIKERDYFLIVSRLVKYKRIDLAIEACNKLELPLKIIGDGMERNKLQNLSGPTIEFLGNLTDEELSYYYQNCRAVLFVQEEDFGIVAVEALASGKPVICYRKGGATEIIKEGKSGEFFFPQSSQALSAVLEKFLKNTYSQAFCQLTSRKYTKKRFKREFSQFVTSNWLRFKHQLY